MPRRACSQVRIPFISQTKYSAPSTVRTVQNSETYSKTSVVCGHEMKLAHGYLLVISTLCLASRFLGEEIRIQTRFGSIQGRDRHFPDAQGSIKSVHKFLGVPYAAPPVAELRFQPPKPPPSWKPRVYNATYFRNVCYQDPAYNKFFWPNFSQLQSDDCLYLNIYTPANSSSEKPLYPVMVYIHGGGYEAGTPVVSPGDVIPLWGIVLVTIQYRLGPLGFITTDDSNAPGNYGMLDQVEALKWVQKNIGDFRGDPSSVTIFGESAGGSSVALHLLSPLSEGLFHRAIAMSGVATSPFAIGSSCEMTRQSRMTAEKAGCRAESKSGMMKCLRSKSVKEISVQDVNVWRPIVDGNFLLDSPDNLRRAGKFYRVPFMAGFTNQDGASFFPQLFANLTSENYRATTAAVFQEIGSRYGQKMATDIPKDILDTLVLLYKPWAHTYDSFKLKRGLAAVVTDYCFAAPVHAELTLHSQAGAPVYFYEFSHRSKFNPSPPWKGVAHKDDTPYEFGFPLMNLTVLQEYDDTDRNVSRLVITLFTNFAKYGNPTPQPVRGVTWDRFNSSHMTYMRIQAEPEMALNYQPTRMAFWNVFYSKELNSSGNTCASDILKTSGSQDVGIELITLVLGVLGKLLIC